MLICVKKRSARWFSRSGGGKSYGSSLGAGACSQGCTVQNSGRMNCIAPFVGGGLICGSRSPISMAVSSNDTLLEGPKKRSSTDVRTIDRLKFCANSSSSLQVTGPWDSKRVPAVPLPRGHLAALAPADIANVGGNCGTHDVAVSGDGRRDELEAVAGVVVVEMGGGEAEDAGGGGSLTTVLGDAELPSMAPSNALEYRARFTRVSLMIAGFVGAWYVGERMVLSRGSMLLRKSAIEAESAVAARPWRDDLYPSPIF